MREEITSTQPLDTGAQRILTIQSLWALAITVFFYLYQDATAARAALFGAAIVMFNVWMTHRRLQKAAMLAETAPGQEVPAFYLAAIQRFIFTVLFFIIGMGWLQWSPVPMLIAFGVAQLGFMFSKPTSHKSFKSLNSKLIKS